MGASTAQAFANEVAEGNCPIEAAVQYHLRQNHYPPPPVCMVEPCVEAINYANEGNYDADVFLPTGVTWRGSTMVPVRALVESFHLQSFINSDEG